MNDQMPPWVTEGPPIDEVDDRPDDPPPLRTDAHATYEYRNADGSIAFIIARWEAHNGHKKKSFSPFCWNGSEWVSKQLIPAGKRPLLNLDKITANPAAPILWVEGEKKAIVARKYLPEQWIVTTWAGGADGITGTDISPLAGRIVTAWPDNNEAGLRAVKKLAAAIPSVRVVDLPLDLPDGWDLGDPLPEGRTAEWVADLIVGAKAETPPESEKSDNPADWTITATPFLLRDPATIPKREFIPGTKLSRKHLSLIVAASGVGKTAFGVAELVALAAGRRFNGDVIDDPPDIRVWIFNLEDPKDEIERRIAAVCQRHEITAEELGDRLFMDSGRDQGICLATITRNGGATVCEPVYLALIAEIKRRRIDVFSVDPFISSHNIPENDNNAIDVVSKLWAKIAEETNCAIILTHHIRKTGDQSANAESSRGASSLVATARSVRVFNRMTKEEGDKAGVKYYRRYFNVVDDKNNLAPPAENADWYHLENVSLANGDEVGVVIPWSWPDAFEGVTVAHLYAVQVAIDGQNYRMNVQAKDWVGHAIGRVLNLDTDTKAQQTKIKSLIKTWIQNGSLVETTIKDKYDKERPVIEVGTWAPKPSTATFESGGF